VVEEAGCDGENDAYPAKKEDGAANQEAAKSPVPRTHQETTMNTHSLNSAHATPRPEDENLGLGANLV